PKDNTLLRARSLVADYGPGSHLRQVHAHQDVEIDRRLPGQTPQVTRSDEGDVDFDADHWTEARQSGNVRFEESGPQARRGHSDRSRSIHANDTLMLTGNAEISDADTDSAAPTFNLDQRTGEARGEGGVRTTYRRVDQTSVANFAPQPAHVSAEKMTAWRSTGRALYTGHARLWQGDAVIQADTIELRQQERLLLASGNVNARLPQVQPPPAAEPPADSPKPPAAPPAAGTAAGTSTAAAAAGPVVWAVRAAKLTYRSADAVAELSQNVIAESRLGRIAAPHMDLILSQTNGVQQLSKTVSTGGVTVWQQGRRGTSERADYTAADGRFVLSGGNPTLFDADQGTTTGRELTFFLSDDRILIDSGNGTRTLSRHRIQ
ncbi:MAG TPA: LptA/OstA family protein, partial [Candidatus Acidoferrales bacterium]|nr:LptA/OstA family protein [Candidatus Acidoferrales bacterium]